MNIDQYKAEIAAIEKEAKLNKNEVSRKYSMANKRCEIGDVVKGNTHVARVESIKWGFGFRTDAPSAVYVCLWLKANGEDRKVREMVHIYDRDVTQINGVKTNA